MKKKLSSNSGFTLFELLIVVAILAILVALSIPMFTSNLETARDSTDQYNERAAKSEASYVYNSVVASVQKSGNAYAAGQAKTTGLFAYNAETGKLHYIGDEAKFNPNMSNYAVTGLYAIDSTTAKTYTSTDLKINAYGKCTGSTTCSDEYKNNGLLGGKSHVGCIILVDIANDGTSTIKWFKLATS